VIPPRDRPTPHPSRASRAPVPPVVPAAGERRCGCGSLLARLLPEGVELKCRRCKRVVTLTFGELSAREASTVL
jgi:hypothetical protein